MAHSRIVRTKKHRARTYVRSEALPAKLNSPLTLRNLYRAMKLLENNSGPKYSLPIDPKNLSFILAHPEIYRQLPDGNFEVI